MACSTIAVAKLSSCYTFAIQVHIHTEKHIAVQLNLGILLTPTYN